MEIIFIYLTIAWIAAVAIGTPLLLIEVPPDERSK